MSEHYTDQAVRVWDESSTYIRVGSRERIEFVEAHPEWRVTYVRAWGYFQATRDHPNTIITDYDLTEVLRRVKEATET